MSDSSKIHASHLQRFAFIYLRQSTAAQVEQNRESTRRQYALASRAVELGWPSQQVTVIDEDLGLSGSGAVERNGFARLAADVGLGRVGIVLGLEVSRLARNNADWAYQRRTKAADALIAGAYLAGTNTRRVRRALKAVFAGEVGKDVVSRTWRKVKGDWDAWNARSLTDEPIMRLILDGTVVRVRVDKKATSISLLVALGVREDGQKVLLAIKNMGGESEAAWRALLDDLVKRGLKTPELVIVDGAPGLEKALAALWPVTAIRAARARLCPVP